MKPKYIRILFVVAIGIMFLSLLGRWEETFPPVKANKQQVKENHYIENNVQNTKTVKQQINSKTNFSKSNSVGTVIVNTKTFKDVKVSLLNGSIISTSLKNYNVSLENKTPMNLLDNTKGSEYEAKSIIVINKKPVDVTFKNNGIKKEVNKTILTLKGSVDGLNIVRTYTFDNDKYTINVSQKVTNTTTETINVITDNSLVRTFDTSKDGFSLLDAHSYTFSGVAYSADKDSFRKVSFKDMNEAGTKTTTVEQKGKGWVAFLQHYFMSAWIPQSTSSIIYYKKTPNGVFQAGEYTYNNISAKSTVINNSVLYNGPIIKKNLENLAPNIDKSLDYGMLSFFSVIIFYIMDAIHSLIGNWGFAIILVTLIIKAIFYPLSAKSYKSMAKMRMLQPRMKSLQETYKDDKQALGRKMMEMYKEEKVSPLSGCLPMVIQIPIFIALYWVLLESVQLRQAPFMFWIHDLSVKDPYYILPILMGLSMFAQQKISPAPADPMQAKMMLLLPVVFTFLFSSFPAGLVLYWLTNNIISISQQWFITKRFEATHKKNR